MRLTRYVLCVVGALSGVLLMASASPVAASSSTTDRLEVTVAGGGSPFDLTGVYPGFSTSTVVEVQNNAAEVAVVDLSVANVSSDDNGCNDPESAVDSSCGADGGELAGQLLLQVERVANEGGEQLLPPTLLADLEADHPLEPSLAPGQRSRYVLTLALPSSSGNETQTDSAEFDIVFSSAAQDASGVALAVGSQRGRPGTSESHVLGAQVWTADRLPATGSGVLAGVPIGAAGVALGTVVMWFGSYLRSRR